MSTHHELAEWVVANVFAQRDGAIAAMLRRMAEHQLKMMQHADEHGYDELVLAHQHAAQMLEVAAIKLEEGDLT